MSISLEALREFLGSRRVRELEAAHQTIPLSQRQGMLSGLSQFHTDLGNARRYEPVLTEWATQQAETEEDVRRLKASDAKRHMEDVVGELISLYEEIGVDFEGESSPHVLREAWNALSQRVDGHIRDRRNLGPTRLEKAELDLQQQGAVAIEERSDPLIEGARAIREGLSKLEVADEYAQALQSNIEVDPAELDRKWCLWLEDLEKVHGPTVPNPLSIDYRPFLSPELEQRLREWGLGQSTN